MTAFSRREFIKVAAAYSAAAGILGVIDAEASPLGMPIGCQTWPVREMIAKDFPATLKLLSDAGFQAIELCSPAGYSDLGFGDLAKYKGSELKKMLRDAGVACVSSHFTMEELRANQEERIAWAKDLGLTQMLVPTLDGPANPTMDDVKRAADEYNKMGERAAKAGIQQGLHTEDFELSSVDGKRTYDVLMGLLDPKLVKFQFQVSTVGRGFDPVEYFKKYPGRYVSMHVQGWSSQTKKVTAVGQDTLDWKSIFSAAGTCGIKNYFVEMNLELMKASVGYLRALNV